MPRTCRSRDHRGDRDQPPADTDVARHSVGPLAVGILDAQRDDRRVRGGERQHRPERVEVAEHVDVREGDQQHGEPEKKTIVNHGVR